MADFLKELGTGLKTAINANGATFGKGLGKTGSAYHVEYGDQPVAYLQMAGSRCYIRWERDEQHEENNTSADESMHFIAIFKIVDVKGKDNALTLVKKGMAAAFANKGFAALNTHLVDSANNRLGGSGEITVQLDVTPLDALQNIDAPLLYARISVRLTHAVPLV